jgi:hypothetical protein
MPQTALMPSAEQAPVDLACRSIESRSSAFETSEALIYSDPHPVDRLLNVAILSGASDPSFRETETRDPSQGPVRISAGIHILMVLLVAVLAFGYVYTYYHRQSDAVPPKGHSSVSLFNSPTVANILK